MNNKELTSALAAATGSKVSEAGRLLENVTMLMGDHFTHGDSVQLAGLGTFEVRKKMERVIVNPGTGQRMLVPPKLVLGFKPHKGVRSDE